MSLRNFHVDDFSIIQFEVQKRFNQIKTMKIHINLCIQTNNQFDWIIPITWIRRTSRASKRIGMVTFLGKVGVRDHWEVCCTLAESAVCGHVDFHWRSSNTLGNLKTSGEYAMGRFPPQSLVAVMEASCQGRWWVFALVVLPPLQKQCACPYGVATVELTRAEIRSGDIFKNEVKC